MQDGGVSLARGAVRVGEEGEIQNLSCGLLFSNDLFNNYLCNQRNQGPAEKKISTLHTPWSSRRRK